MSTQYPNILLVSGNGRNSGKTTLVCSIIENLAKKHTITGIKISPHFHSEEDEDDIIVKQNGFSIYREYNTKNGKDSSRMLKAGAREVYYIQTDDKSLKEAFDYIYKKLGQDSLVIIESARLRNVIHPELFLIVNKQERTDFKESVKDLVGLADKMILFNDTDFDFDLSVISADGNKWILRD